MLEIRHEANIWDVLAISDALALHYHYHYHYHYSPIT